jgi:catechol 2,3-dioxygenase-like lactoylglutathione lyase family enzyme
MLGEKTFSSFSVDDIRKAKEFYGGTLGLDVSEINVLLRFNPGGSSNVLLYPKAKPTPKAA